MILLMILAIDVIRIAISLILLGIDISVFASDRIEDLTEFALDKADKGVDALSDMSDNEKIENINKARHLVGVPVKMVGTGTKVAWKVAKKGAAFVTKMVLRLVAVVLSLFNALLKMIWVEIAIYDLIAFLVILIAVLAYIIILNVTG